MPNPVCAFCSVSMKPHRLGAVVQINALSVNGAYQQWFGDVYKCPECDVEIVVKFADRPAWEHFHKTPPAIPDYIVEERIPSSRPGA